MATVFLFVYKDPAIAKLQLLHIKYKPRNSYAINLFRNLNLINSCGNERITLRKRIRNSYWPFCTASDFDVT